MDSIANFMNGVASWGQPVFGNLGVGNIYYVCYTTDTQGRTVYDDMVLRFGGQRYENDGSAILHTTIQSALDATVECRNDYVVVQPKNVDYDITATLTMSKKAVHMVCPAGMGYDIGANNACRIEQTTSALPVITLSDSAIEVAGFYFKPYTAYNIMTMTAGTYAPNVHHNYFVLKGSNQASTGAAITGATTAGAWGNIERNKFEAQSSGQTYPWVVMLAGGGTGAQVNHNQFICNGSIMTVGISVGTYGSANHNEFMQSGNAGSIVSGVNIGVTGSAIGNRGCVASDTLLNGGTAGGSFCDNLDGRTTSGSDIWNLES